MYRVKEHPPPLSLVDDVVVEDEEEDELIIEGQTTAMWLKRAFGFSSDLIVYHVILCSRYIYVSFEHTPAEFSVLL